jgi:flagellar biosynthesis/type III secretory pathway M-ring protein FliF/YscJ
MKLDTFDIDENSIKNNSNDYKRYSVESLKEYNLAINDIDEEQENTKNIKKEIKIKKKLPFLVYIFILTAIFFLSTLIFFVIVYLVIKKIIKRKKIYI